MDKKRTYNINEVAPEHAKGYISARMIKTYGQMISSQDFKDLCAKTFVDYDPNKTSPQFTNDKQYISRQQFFDDIFEGLANGTSYASIKNPKTGKDFFEESPIAGYKQSHPAEFAQALDECLKCFGSRRISVQI
jgi:hypothetical protein